MNQAFSRNIGLLTECEQEKLGKTRVAIPGMGGVGGAHLITLVRSGIGKFNIADFDVFDPVNINRQYGATVDSFNKPKLEEMKERALSINPYLELNCFENGINEENIDHFLDEVDVVIDGLDFFAFEIRRKMFLRAAQKGIYVVTAAPLGFSSAVLVFSPNGMGFDEYFNVNDDMSSEDKYLSFAMGLAPKPTHFSYMNLAKVDLNAKAGPSLSIACQLCSGMAAAEALKIVLNRGCVNPVPCYIQYDSYLNRFKKGKLHLGNKNPVQQVKKIIVKKLLTKKGK
ncbi:ThiF family adenylyltransferase [uncultured Desulfobacter sp.]|uniref:ThiF family adenylyltransferase n=1 Tax=uncultured Desulfobacter sp. TaxID=240139 RepID=UPI002AAC4305|nr:ThiF family adenylyltransferase [uncultured Desulfobacter sp.]